MNVDTVLLGEFMLELLGSQNKDEGVPFPVFANACFISFDLDYEFIVHTMWELVEAGLVEYGTDAVVRLTEREA